MDTKVILAAITLDLFAVLLGGATALLPIFAKDILHVGPDGLGWLRAAPSVGALMVMPSRSRIARRCSEPGWTLILAVAGFGIATIVFGLSRSFWLSMAMLFVLGGTRRNQHDHSRRRWFSCGRPMRCEAECRR